MFDYNEFKRETLAAVNAYGNYCSTPLSIAWLDPAQLRTIRAVNFITDEKWQFRLLADRTRLVEISYGWMMGAPALGLTVFSKDPADRDGDAARGKCCFSIAELTDALDALSLVDA